MTVLTGKIKFKVKCHPQKVCPRLLSTIKAPSLKEVKTDLFTKCQ